MLKLLKVLESNHMTKRLRVVLVTSLILNPKFLVLVDHKRDDQSAICIVCICTSYLVHCVNCKCRRKVISISNQHPRTAMMVMMRMQRIRDGG
jgi:hypothetical protein